MSDIDEERRNLIESIGAQTPPWKLSGVTMKEAMERMKTNEEFQRQDRVEQIKKGSKSIPKIEISSVSGGTSDIMITLNDGSYLVLSPNMSEPGWKLELDFENFQYHTTSDTWCERIKPNGVIPLWKNGEDVT